MTNVADMRQPRRPVRPRLVLRLVAATAGVEVLYALALFIAIPIGPIALAITFALAVSLAVVVGAWMAAR